MNDLALNDAALNHVAIVASMTLAAWCAMVIFSRSPARSVRSVEPDGRTTGTASRRGRIGSAFASRPRPWRRAGRVRSAPVAAWADDLARSLRRGATLHAALSEIIPIDDAVTAATAGLRQRLARGSTVTEACDGWSDELQQGATDCRRLATLAIVLSAAATLGGSNAEPLERYAVAMRERASDDLERAAQSAQAKLSMRVLTWVPLAVLAVLVGTDPDVRAAITQARGAMVVFAGLALNVVGGVWMHTIVEPRQT